MLFINHQICNEQSIDLEAGVEDFQTQWFVKEGEKKNIFCTVAMVFPFHSEPFSRRAPGVSALQLIDLFLAVPPPRCRAKPSVSRRLSRPITRYLHLFC